MVAVRMETGLHLSRRIRWIVARTALPPPCRPRPKRRGNPFPLGLDEASEPTPRPLPPT